jgi:hypothetical protein
MSRSCRLLFPLVLAATTATALPGCDGDPDPVDTPDAAPATADAAPDADLPPSLHFVTPVASAALRQTTVIAVDPGDDEGVVLVQLFLDNELIAEEKFAPYRFDVDTTLFPEGEHELKAVAHDTLGQRKAIAQPIFFDNTPPTIAFVGLSSSETPTKIILSVSDNVGLADVVADAPIVEVKTAPPFEFTFDAGCFAGQTAFTATDRAGWTSTIFPSFSVVDSCDRDCDSAERAGCGGDDCDDANFSTRPGAFEAEFDGVDSDCDGTDGTDLDKDGVPVGPDCDDSAPDVHGAFFAWSGEPTTLVGDVANLAMAGDVPSVCTASPSPFAVACARPLGAGWATETVTGAPDFRSAFVGVQGGANGADLVVTSGDENGHLGVFVRQADAWNRVALDEQATPASDFGFQGIATARDASGHTHLVYAANPPFFGGQRFLRYGSDASGSWEFETIAFIDFDSDVPEVLVSPAGVPHVVFTNGGFPSPRVLRRSEGAWLDLPQVGFFSQTRATAAFDPSGMLHLVWAPEFSTSIEHSTLAPDATEWTHEPVGGHVPAAFDYDLACDSPTSCALLAHTSPPFYAQRVGGSWYGHTVLGTFVTMSRLVLDGLGHPHAAFLFNRPGVAQFGSVELGVPPASDPAGDGVDRDCDGLD